MIQLENIRKVYSDDGIETIALSGITLEVHRGEFVAIMGPSGCGKTTLLNVLGLLDQPTSGRYLFNNCGMEQLKENERTRLRKGRIGFVFQSFNLIDELNVAENVELPLTYLDVPKKERQARVEEMLRRMNLSHRAHHYPHQLSGGQQQRVAVARAVVARPDLILADEPTGNLDSRHGMEVMQLLTELNRTEGITVIMVTHSERDAGHAQRIVKMLDGQVVHGASDLKWAY